MPDISQMVWFVLPMLRPEGEEQGKMNRHQTMYNTNRLAKQWLLSNGYDWIWLKPHHDSRKSKFKETYLTKDGVFYARDLYNLFDGICFDQEGAPVLLQLSTTNYHPEEKYQDFIRDKKGISILMIKAVKKKNKWELKTKQIIPPMRLIFQ